MKFKRWPQKYHLIKLSRDDYPFLLTSIRSLDPGEFFTLIFTHQEISAVISDSRLKKVSFTPGGLDEGWTVFSLIPTWDLQAKGIISKFSTVLANQGFSIGIFSSFDTDHMIVKNENADQVEKVLNELSI